KSVSQHLKGVRHGPSTETGGRALEKSRVDKSLKRRFMELLSESGGNTIPGRRLHHYRRSAKLSGQGHLALRGELLDESMDCDFAGRLRGAHGVADRRTSRAHFQRARSRCRS